MDSGASLDEVSPFRPSLFDTKDDFIGRVAPIGMAAIYFGSFTLAPQDAALSRQALFKLSFAYRQFLQPGGLRIAVQGRTATLSGAVKSRTLVTLAEILIDQIEGINQFKDETETEKSSGSGSKTIKFRDADAAREMLHLLFATDQTLRTGVQVSMTDGTLVLEGYVSTAAQKNWAELLVASVGCEAQSKLKVAAPSSVIPISEGKPPKIDDESLQALILLRLRLVRETEHLPVRVKANRGIVSLQGKVRTEALRQRVENIARSTLGLQELRSTLSITA
ncbi:BON domain-containing protein [Methylacidiphilales bacterium]|nr:BON domain-containing protein [Candidatus Methylacidiphilales bacterium]